MFKTLKLKRAKKHDAKNLRKLFLAIDPKIAAKDIDELIKEKQVIVLKKRKKIKAAFAYTIIGIAGIFSFMYVKKIAVEKNSRGKGLGTYLLKQIKNFSISKKVNYNVLYSLKQAAAFYKKNKLDHWGSFFWWKNK